ncbi:MAG: endonuclease MutS2 [Anaerolineales bacterium]
MDQKSIAKLELPKVLEILAGHADFSASKELARQLVPTANLDEAEARQQETSEARQLLEEHESWTIGGAHDVRQLTEDAARGAVLEASSILRIKDTLVATRTQSRFLEDREHLAPRLTELAADLVVPEGLIDRISQVLDDRGEVLDSASDKLAKIRKDHKVANDRLLTKMQSIVNDSKIADWLQEAIVTQREGRYVVPLRAEFKGRLKSIVHDQSSSGATLFVEPLSVVDLNNEVRELALAERDEIRRILAALCANIGQSRATIDTSVEALARLDLALAKARYAIELDCSRPTLKPAPRRTKSGEIRTTFKLLGARHPLLEPSTVVPIDLTLEQDTRGLIITGPNTGGKTVALKSAGLLALMAQCGLQLPVESGSAISVFQGIYADIGDEQSIEQSLSTFSAHIANIIRILELADLQSLVLLDELGSGTDPQEGASLAMAILRELLDRGSTTLVATHYPEMKAFAHTTTGVQNASVQFDLETLQPTYRLSIGLPGRSNALAIADRLGLPASIIEQARQQLDPQELQADELLDEIHAQREAAERARAEADVTQQEAEAARQELTERLESIEQERRSTLEAARERGEEELAEIQKEIRKLRQQLALAGQPLEAVKEVEERAEELVESAKVPVAREAIDVPRPDYSLQPGDRVYVPTLKTEGVIEELGEREAEVQVGNLRLRAKIEELRPAEANDEPEAPSEPAYQRPSSPGAAPGMELDLRGRTVEEALTELERRLDAALLAGLPYVRVIHGKGTGRLRQAIRSALPSYKFVSSFEGGDRAEGGEGVTVVKFEG